MLKKIVVIGPESTGKSTLAKSLADHYKCKWVQEYARQYLDNLDQPYQYEDLEAIGRGQVGLEDEAIQNAAKLLICDTDLRVIQVWSEHKYGKVSPWVKSQIESRKYDLYLLTDIDIPWQEDPQREHPDPVMRKYFFEWYERLLKQSKVNYVVISGDFENRMKESIRTINKLLQ